MLECGHGDGGLIVAGPSLEWLARWPLQFAIARPIPFALTMGAWPASMELAAKALSGKPRSADHTVELATH